MAETIVKPQNIDLALLWYAVGPYVITSHLVDYTYMAWEAITAGQCVFVESWRTFALAIWEAYVGYDTSTTRQSFPFVGNWATTIDLKLSLKKVGSPSAALSVRIETDNAWSPSGTLLEVDSHWTVAAWSLTTSLADTTVTLTGACVPIAWVKYHVVLNQVWDVVNSSNYYMYWFQAIDSTTRWPKVRWWASRWARVATVYPYLYCDWAEDKLLSLTDSDYSYKVDLKWISTEAAAIGAKPVLTLPVEWSINSNQTWLTDSVDYYLGATPWSISATEGTYIRQVWTAQWTEKIIFRDNWAIIPWTASTLVDLSNNSLSVSGSYVTVKSFTVWQYWKYQNDWLLYNAWYNSWWWGTPIASCQIFVNGIAYWAVFTYQTAGAGSQAKTENLIFNKNDFVEVKAKISTQQAWDAAWIDNWTTKYSLLTPTKYAVAINPVQT